MVKRLAADLNLGAKIVGCPTIREEDGLAMSSRNLRLGEAARGTALVIVRVLTAAAAAIARGEFVEGALATAGAGLRAAGFHTIDYLEMRGDPDLQPMRRADRLGGLFLAAWIDGVRLIDNCPVAEVRTVAAV